MATVNVAIPIGINIKLSETVDRIREVHPRVWTCNTVTGHIHCSDHTYGLFDGFEDVTKFLWTDANKWQVTRNEDHIHLFIKEPMARSYWKIYGLTEPEIIQLEQMDPCI